MAPAPHRTARFLSLACGPLLPLALVGCLAQHADVKRLEDTLAKKIADLDRREHELEQKLQAAQKRIEQQNEYAKRLFQVARARSRQDLRDLRGEELAGLEGKLENADSVLGRSREDIAALQQQLDDLAQVVRSQKTEGAQQLQALGQSQHEQLASLQSDQQTLRDRLGEVQQSLREELGRVQAYVEALGPTLKSLARKIDLQLEEQGKAIQANAVATHSLATYLLEMQRALVTGMPNLAIPSPPEPLPGVTTTPPTPSDRPERP